MRKKRKKKPVSHSRRRHAMPFNFFSGLIYSFTAILAIAFGAFFYRAMRPSQDASDRDWQSHLPPGAKVVTRDALGSVDSHARQEKPKQPAPFTRETAATPRPADPFTTKEQEVQPLAAPAAMPDLSLPSVPAWIPTPTPETLLGKVILKPTADTAIMAHQNADGREVNGGAITDLPLQGNERFFIAQYDLESVSGWSVEKAYWHGKITAGRVHTLGFSTVPVPWQEGAGTLTELPEEGATLRWADHRKTPWRSDRIPLSYLIRGGGGSLMYTGSIEEENHEPYAWVKVEVHPAIAQSLIAGTSHGIAITDEKGQLGGTTTIASRENTQFSHYLEITGARSDVTPPGEIKELTAWGHPDLRRASSVGAVLTWTATGDDDNRGQAFSYDIRYAPAPVTIERARRLPPELTPRPQPAGQPDKAIVEGLEPDTLYTFFVRAMDEVGQPGPFAGASLRTPSPIQIPKTEKPVAHPSDSIDILNGTLSLRIVEETAGINPLSGDVRLGAEKPGQKKQLTSFVWDRNSRTLRLQASRNETIGSILVFGSKQKEMPVIEFETIPFKRADKALGGTGFQLYRTWFSMASPHVWIGDALIPVSGKLSLQEMPNKISGQLFQTVYAELHIPATAEPGTYVGEIRITGRPLESTTLNVLLEVLPTALPLEPSFTVELLGSPNLAMLYRRDVSNHDDAHPIEQSYYRIANDHRCTLAIPPYLATGSFVPPFTPPITGKGHGLAISDWNAWDGRFRSLLGGTAFMASPYGSAPVSHIILPVFENWPTPFEEGFLCLGQEVRIPPEGLLVYGGASGEIEGCMAPDYWRAIRTALRQYRDHFRTRGWRETTAQFWLNNTPSAQYKGMAPLWNLGAPIYRDDFLALESFARFAHTDLNTWSPGGLDIRVGITNGATAGTYGENLFTLLTVSDTDPYTWKELRRRAERTGERLWLQTQVAPMGMDIVGIQATALHFFLAGADGWSIRETIGRPEHWPRAAPQSLLYSGTPIGLDAPVSSMRLKILRRSVQDIQYLSLLQKNMDWNRKQLAEFVYRQVPALAHSPHDVNAGDLYILRQTVQQALATP